MPVAVTLLAVAALSALAQGQGAAWSFDLYDAENGQTTYMLSYRVPETDAIAFIATCRTGMHGPAMPVLLSVDHNVPGEHWQPVTLSLTGSARPVGDSLQTWQSAFA